MSGDTEKREFWLKKLCFFHNTIVASIPLLQFAAARSDGDLREYFRKHEAEESGHAEILADDLKRCGVTQVSLEIAAVEVAGAQYYLIAHTHPAALLGYMAALERHPLTEAQIVEVETLLGTDMKCLRLHTALDAHHIQDIDREIDALIPELKSLAKTNERYTIDKIIGYFSVIASQKLAEAA